MTRLWLLDFDGTLVDSEKAIKACYLKVGLELISERCNFIETMVIGPTLEESSRMILTDKNLHLLDTFKKRFQELYDEKLIYNTPKYNNVDETLKQLHSKGDHLCIVTNKRSYPTHKLLKYYCWENLFEWVACMDTYNAAKNKSDLIKLKNDNIKQYDDVFFVGDTPSDGVAAKKNNIKFIKANYGYGRKEDWGQIPIYRNINKFEEILEI
jgi:phosphoglycolate phosphatase